MIAQVAVATGISPLDLAETDMDIFAEMIEALKERQANGQ